MCKIAWNISKVMWIKCKVAWISDRLRVFGSWLFLKKESLRATLQKNGQNRDSCNSDSRSRHNPKPIYHHPVLPLLFSYGQPCVYRDFIDWVLPLSHTHLSLDGSLSSMSKGKIKSKNSKQGLCHQNLKSSIINDICVLRWKVKTTGCVNPRPVSVWQPGRVHAT